MHISECIPTCLDHDCTEMSISNVEVIEVKCHIDIDEIIRSDNQKFNGLYRQYDPEFTDSHQRPLDIDRFFEFNEKRS